MYIYLELLSDYGDQQVKVSKLKLNPDKMEVVLVGKMEILKDIVLHTLTGVQLTLVRIFKMTPFLDTANLAT